MGWKKPIPSRGSSQEKPERITAPSRAAVTIHVDVAACIRWFWIGLAVALLSWSLRGEQAASVLRTVLQRPLMFLSSGRVEELEALRAPLPAIAADDRTSSASSRRLAP